MTQGVPELRSAWRFSIVEREKEYHLTAKLYRSKLVIEDELGNKIAINKRRKTIKIERWKNVEWHEEY